MKTKDEILTNLAYMTGTEGFTRWSPLFRKHVLSDGVKYLAEAAECYWLMDAIASYHADCMKDEMLRDIQIWTLTVHSRGQATLLCLRDTDDIAFRQEYTATDFPLDSIKLYCAPAGDGIHYVIMLPSEN